jgi:predicted RNase H-like nuclease
MNFVGLDLAWGPVNRSGIAVLDADGRLTYVGHAVADDDIFEAVAPYVEDQCVVAIDAPLVVTNSTGMRPAEIEITRVLGPFHAGAFPAALDKFPDPRGTRLVKALGLDVDPRSNAPRRAIEVFPHPATVALFRLGRTFKYKAKKRRPLEFRRTEFLRFMDAIEGLATSSVPMHVAVNDEWQRLRQAVEQVQRPVDLDRAEDPVDAVMCAYIALYAERRPDDITIYGDFPANGYILTPTLPTGLKPTPREPEMPENITNTLTEPLPSTVAAESQRCARLVTAVQTAWTDIDKKLHVLASIPGRDTTNVSDSLSRAATLLELTEQQLRSVRHKLFSNQTMPGHEVM